MPRQHSKRFENQTGTRPRKWVNSTSVLHAGINNLPKNLLVRIAQALGSPTEADDPLQAPLADWVPAEVRAQAAQSGYGNAFESIRACLPGPRGAAQCG